jgi:hypothetical protein
MKGSCPSKEPFMKLFALLAAAAGLSGCVAYPYGGPGYYGQGYYGQGYYQGSPYVVEPQSSLYIYGGSGYRGERGSHYGRRDRDRDGIPDRVDRDRDGDGVPNRADRRPYDPRRN